MSGSAVTWEGGTTSSITIVFNSESQLLRKNRLLWGCISISGAERGLAMIREFVETEGGGLDWIANAPTRETKTHQQGILHNNHGQHRHHLSVHDDDKATLGFLSDICLHSSPVWETNTETVSSPPLGFLTCLGCHICPSHTSTTKHPSTWVKDSPLIETPDYVCHPRNLVISLHGSLPKNTQPGQRCKNAREGGGGPIDLLAPTSSDPATVKHPPKSRDHHVFHQQPP